MQACPQQPAGECSHAYSPALSRGIEQSALTLQPCKTLVDEWVAVSEHEIAAALLGLLEQDQLRCEGSPGLLLTPCIACRL